MRCLHRLRYRKPLRLIKERQFPEHAAWAQHRKRRFLSRFDDAIDPNVTGLKEVDRVTQIAFMKDNVLRRMICLSKQACHLLYLVERNASKEAVTLQKPDFVWHGGRGSQKAGKDFSKAFERRRPGYSLPTRQDEGGSDQWNSWKESFAIETVHLEADPRVFAGQLCHSLDST